MNIYDRVQKSMLGDYHESHPWDMAAPWYDHLQPIAFKLAGVLGHYSYGEYARTMVSRLSLKTPGRIVDTACGTGFLHKAIVDVLPPDSICHAVDFSGGMLLQARRKLHDEPRKHFSFHKISIYRLAEHFPPASFDGAFLSFTLPVLEKPDLALRAIHTVLAENAPLIISTLSREQMDEQRSRPFWRLLIRHHHLRYPYQNELMALFDAAGFNNVTFERIGWSWLITLYAARS